MTEQDSDSEVEVKVNPRSAVIPPPKPSLGISKVLKVARALGWSPQFLAFLERTPAVYWASDGEGRAAGDLRKAAAYALIVQMFARHPKVRLGFVAEWVDGKFSWAKVADPVGIPIELYADYGIDHNQAKALGMSKEAAKAAGDRISAQYNDGASHLVRTHFFKTTVTPFTTWLADWQAMLTPTKETK